MSGRFSPPEEDTEEIRRIKLACRHATEDALRKLRAAGLPRTYIREGQVVREWPDGRIDDPGEVHTP